MVKLFAELVSRHFLEIKSREIQWHNLERSGSATVKTPLLLRILPSFSFIYKRQCSKLFAKTTLTFESCVFKSLVQFTIRLRFKYLTSIRQNTNWHVILIVSEIFLEIKTFKYPAFHANVISMRPFFIGSEKWVLFLLQWNMWMGFSYSCTLRSRMIAPQSTYFFFQKNFQPVTSIISISCLFRLFPWSVNFIIVIVLYGDLK